MKTMKAILAAALVAASLVGGLGIDAMKVRGCKPEVHTTSNETAGDFWNRRERTHNGTAVAAVRG